MMINDDVFLNFGWGSWFWWHFLFLHCKIVSILVIYVFQYYQLCDSTLVQSRKECSCRWRKRWNIRLGWLSIGFLCFSRKYFSDSLNRISLILLAVLGSDRAKYQIIYALRAPLWLFATNLSWKWLNWAEKGWTGFISKTEDTSSSPKLDVAGWYDTGCHMCLC